MDTPVNLFWNFYDDRRESHLVRLSGAILILSNPKREFEMSDLKPGTLCVIVAGCPENIGMIVEVVTRLGKFGGYEDGYQIKTVTGRNFNQLWVGNHLKAGTATTAYTERYKLRPLVEEGEPDLALDEALDVPKPVEVPA